MQRDRRIFQANDADLIYLRQTNAPVDEERSTCRYTQKDHVTTQWPIPVVLSHLKMLAICTY